MAFLAAPRGVPQIEVSLTRTPTEFRSVSKGSGTGKEQHQDRFSGLSEDEVERMRQEAEKYADEDGSRELVDLQ